MLKDEMKKIISERQRKHLQDDYGIQKCWDKMIELLSNDEQETFEYLKQCSKEDLFFVSEVFEDVAEKLQSRDYIKCLRDLDVKFPDLEMKKDIDIAEECMTNSIE